MESQQIVDYIRAQVAAGHTLERLRRHLLANGWSAAQVDDAFARYQQAAARQVSGSAAAPSAKKAKQRKPRRKRTKVTRVTPARMVVIAAALVILGGVIAGVRFFQSAQEDVQPPVQSVAKLSYEQRQANDVNTVGTSISQYTLENGAMPTGISVAADGTLVLCGTACDPRTSGINLLQTYQAANVKFATYLPNLTVPSQDIMYIVPGATCINKGATIAASRTPKAMAILYDQVNGSSATSRCVIL